MRPTVLVVDDERLARRRLCRMLEDEDGVETIGECSSGPEALEAIVQRSPSIVFLDVQMPQMNGFEVIRSVPPGKRPVVVFVTAFDHYAIKAFEVNAVDYLLKPFDRKRFRMALHRAQKAVKVRESDTKADEKVRHLIDQTQDPGSFDDRLLVRTGAELDVIRISDISWVESAGNYVLLHIGKKTLLYRSTMKQIETRLKNFDFLRVHRGAVVNLAAVSRIKMKPSGDGVILLDDGARVNLSRRHRMNLKVLAERFGPR